MKRVVLILCIGVLVLGVVGLLVGKLRHKGQQNPATITSTSTKSSETTVERDAIKAGKQLSGGKCTGEGVPYKLSVSPMEPDDFTHVIPYGMLAGGHVTPIDHQYFAPKDYRSPVDSYEVFAMADSTIVDISTRTNTVHKATEYRLVFSVSCTFLYYYDLVTSLSSDILSEFERQRNGDHASVNISVTAGQQIGKIGGRTLDFAVWDTTKTLTGFVVPEHYAGEAWKLFTADPLEYYTDELRSFILSRYVRTAEPISGKIDHDIDGKLIGNWFIEGSGGYSLTNQAPAEDYFSGHLAFVPNEFDPTHFMISIGSLHSKVQQQQEMQHMAKTNSPDPATVGIESGIVRYDLARWHYLTADGKQWDKMSLVQGGVTASTENQPSFGCAIVQLTEARKLEFEVFPGTPCANSVNFTSAARTYVR